MEGQLTFDVVEQILVRLDVDDVVRCKSVCKSWLSLISSPCFVKAHLNHSQSTDRNNPQLGHRRMVSHLMYSNMAHLIGSCDGLVCASPKGAALVLANTSTRHQNQLPTPPYHPPVLVNSWDVRRTVCWGFGYDSSAHDYKVVAGFYSNNLTLFYALTLKSNVWKDIGRVRYRCHDGIDGVLCGGALHWLMAHVNHHHHHDNNNNKVAVVLVALDLSTDEFKEIPLPPEFQWNYQHRLGVFESCLCIYSSAFPVSLSTDKWVLKNYNKWEQLYDDHHHCQNKYDVVHHFRAMWSPRNIIYRHHTHTERVPTIGEYLRMSLFVKSLVSPHPHLDGQLKPQGEEGNNTRNRKRKRTRKHKRQI